MYTNVQHKGYKRWYMKCTQVIFVTKEGFTKDISTSTEMRESTKLRGCKIRFLWSIFSVFFFFQMELSA